MYIAACEGCGWANTSESILWIISQLEEHLNGDCSQDDVSLYEGEELGYSVSVKVHPDSIEGGNKK